MRDIPGRLMPVNGRSVYVEETGEGDDWVVLEAGAGGGRTCWDPVIPLLPESARVVAYDRAGRVRTGRAVDGLSIDTMADDLVAVIEAIVPDGLVLVGHSMGGLVVRRAAEHLGPRLRGLLLVDPTPETSPTYDDWGERLAKTDRMLAWSQRLSRFGPVRSLLTANLRHGFSPDTVATIRTEDATPAGIAQTRRELRSVAAAIPQFRLHPPTLPQCPVIVLAAARPVRERPHEQQVVAFAHDHLQNYVQSLPDARFESVDSAHLMQAERPQAIADGIRDLLHAT